MDLRAARLEMSRSRADGAMLTMDEVVRALVGSWRESQNQAVVREEPKPVEVPVPDMGAPLAQAAVQAVAIDCPHPRARVHKALCGACGEHVGGPQFVRASRE
jgi:hypothetical protein